MPLSLDQFVSQINASGLLGPAEVDELRAKSEPADAEAFARELVKQKKLTAFQAQQCFAGKGKSLVLGNYVLLDKLGQGGMGMVLKAQHKRMKRLVAIKVLAPSVAKDKALVARFQREVEAAARLTHPNIVAAFDADEAAGTVFLVMEFVEGQDLSSVVKKTGPLPVEQALRCILQAARGLEFAHKNGVIHRDIKPANLLLDKDGTVKILDMGLARIEGETGSKAELTSTGAVMGTVDYMAPEQALSTKHADARSDIYSLGITLWYVLAGRPAYDGDSLMARLLAHREAPIPSLSAIVDARGKPTTDATPSARGLSSITGPGVDAVFRKMVAKKPEDRYQSMTQVIAALEACLQGTAPTDAVHAALGGPRGESEDHKLSAFLSHLGDSDSGKSRTATVSPTAFTKPVATPSQYEATVTTSDGDVPTDPQTLTQLPKSGSAAPKLQRSRARSTTRVWWQDRRMQYVGGAVAAALLLIAVLQRGKAPESDAHSASTAAATAGALPARTNGDTVSTGGSSTPAASPVFAGDYELAFDGEGRVEIGQPLNYDVNSCTVEAWVQCTAASRGANVVALMSQCGIGLDTSDGTHWRASHLLDPNGHFAVDSNVTAQTSQRVHVAAVFTAESLDLYVDGQLRGRRRRSAEKLRSTQTGPLLGVRFIGTLDEVRFSSVARYSQEFKPPARHQPDEHTLALYHCDEGTGTTLHDASRHRRDGVIRGAKWVKVGESSPPAQLATVESSPAPPNYALRFDDTTCSVDVKAVKYDGSHPLTVEAWVKLGPVSPEVMAKSSAEHVIMHPLLQVNYHRGKRAWQLQTQTEKTQFFPTGYAPHVETDDWVHVAGLLDGGRLRLYVNGTERLNHPLDSPARFRSPGGQDLFCIGAGPEAAGCRFHGLVDEVRISKVARYSQNFTPERRFTADGDTLALYHFDEGTGTDIADASSHRRPLRLYDLSWGVKPKWERVDVPVATVAAPSPAAEWVTLFDGRDTSAWETLGPFRVQDGLLTSTDGGANAISKADYADFELEAEWRVGPRGNGGIYYREPPAVTIGAGNEYQMLDDAAYVANQPPLMRTGSLYGLIAPSTPAARPVGEWNQTRIVCRGTQVEHWLNGQQVVSYDTASQHWQQLVAASTFGHKGRIAQHATGRILLQGHTGEVAFRAIRIRQLTSATGQPAPVITLTPVVQAITELNQGDYNTAPWPSVDGLRLYWESAGDAGQWSNAQTVMASRPDAASPFGPPQPVVSGRMATLSDDELELVCVPAGQREIHVAYRKAASQPFGPLQQLLLQGAPQNPKSPCLLAGGTRLLLQDGDVPTNGFLRAARTGPGAPWEPMTRLEGMQPADHGSLLTWPFVGRDGLQIWYGHGGDRATEIWTGTRDSVDVPFARFEPVQVNGQTLIGRSPRYCAATQELFFSRPVGEAGWELAVVKNYDPLPKPVTPATGFALQFDGVDDYVELAPGWQYDGGDLTFEAWVVPAAVPNSGACNLFSIDHGDSTSRHALRFLRRHLPKPDGQIDRKLHLSAPPSAAVRIADDPLVPGQRAHLAAVRTGTELRIFVNGKRMQHWDFQYQFQPRDVPAYAWLGAIAVSRSTVPGYRPKDGWAGTIEQVRLTTGALYAQDFTPQEQFAADAQTIALYKFDEGSGDIVRDASGHGRDGKIFGAKWVQPPGAAATTSLDREIAEWAISKGGGVWWWGAPTSEVKDRTQLPVTPFTLRSLFLVNVPVAVEELRRVSELQGLWKLALHGSGTTDDGLEHFRDHSYLRQVQLYGCPMTDESIATLSSLERLDSVNLGATQITSAGIRRLADARPGIVEWHIPDLPTATDATLDILKLLPAIKEIDVRGTAVTRAGVEAFRKAHPAAHVLSDVELPPSMGAAQPAPATDLLSRVDPAQGGLQYDVAAQHWTPGGWTKVANGYQSAAVGRCLLRSEAAVTPAYRITVEATPLSVNETSPAEIQGGLWVPLRVGTAECYFTANGYVKEGQATAAFAYVDGEIEFKNSTSRPHPAFQAGQSVRLDIDVEVRGDRATLVAWLNGTEITRFTGAVSQLSIPANYTRLHDGSQVNYGVGTTNGEFVVTKLELQPREVLQP